MLSSKRISFGIATALAFVCLQPMPARAAVHADFNHDGVPDGVQVSPTETRVVVRVSGRQPQVLQTQLLRLRDRLISIVAFDIDHDGHLDLGAVSERRRLFIWLNNGGKGRFTLLKKKHVARTQRHFSGASILPFETPDERPLAQQAKPDADPVVRVSRGDGVGLPPSQSLIVAPRDLRTDRGRAALATPRAPPALM